MDLPADAVYWDCSESTWPESTEVTMATAIIIIIIIHAKHNNHADSDGWGCATIHWVPRSLNNHGKENIELTIAPPVNVALGAVTVLQTTSITTDHLSALSAV